MNTPHDTTIRDDEAELGVIGSLICAQAVDRLRSVQAVGLRAEYFYSSVHRGVFLVVVELVRHLGELDEAAFITLLGDVPGFETPDARRRYLDQVLGVAPTSMNAVWFAERVVDAYRRREAARVLDEQRERLAMPKADVAAVVETTRQRLAKITTGKPDETPVVRSTWRPFPVDVLPVRLQTLVVDGAEAVHVDPTFVLLPALAVAATAIGNARRIAVNETWSEPAAVWAAIVGDMGRKKSPPFKLACEPLNAAQDELDDAHVPPDDEKNEPPRRVLMATDTTIEKLAGILQDNPRGIGVFRDELSSWFTNLTKYGRGGSDVAHWLELFNDGTLRVHRKTGTPKYVSVRFANVTLCGTIQPETLQRCLAGGNVDNGLASRFLFVAPPKRLVAELPKALPSKTRNQWAVIVRRLLGIELPTDDRGRALPVCLPLTDEARVVWESFYLAHQHRLHDASGAYAGALSKLERYVLRLALIFHLVNEADDPCGDDTAPITVDAMRSAVAAIEWFIGETERIYSQWSESDEAGRLRRLLEWLAGRGGRAAIRDMIAAKLYGTADEAEADLAKLIAAGDVTSDLLRHDGPGRPGTEYLLQDRRRDAS
jgi:hypothetical protein